MELRELLYAIEGEVEEDMYTSDLGVLIQTSDGQTLTPEGVASDGALLIINCRPAG